jgi:hypothetical protein
MPCPGKTEWWHNRSPSHKGLHLRPHLSPMGFVRTFPGP